MQQFKEGKSMEEFSEVLIDVQKEYKRSNKLKL